VTIEVSQQKFETEKKQVVILDAPGHLDFVPNMIGGTSQADFAILIIDGSQHFESGFSEKGQTREHAHLAKNLGVLKLIVAINKLDLYDWSETRFNSIVSQLSPFLVKSVGFKMENLFFLPISGLNGINLSKNVTNTTPKLHSWYKGKCLTQIIDDLPKVPRLVDKPFRLTIDDVYKPQNLKGF
jgi:elongation factor 1 alpha-like protein